MIQSMEVVLQLDINFCTRFILRTFSLINSGLSLTKGITGSRNIPQAMPSLLIMAASSSLSVGDGTHGSKIALILLSAEDKLNLTMARLCSLIFFRISIFLLTSVDLVRMCTGKLCS